MHPGACHGAGEDRIVVKRDGAAAVGALHILQDDRVLSTTTSIGRDDHVAERITAGIDDRQRARDSTGINVGSTVGEVAIQTDELKGAGLDTNIGSVDGDALQDPLLAAQLHANSTTIESKIILETSANNSGS